MPVNKIIQKLGGIAGVIFAGLCLCLVILCTHYARKAKEAELSLGVVLIAQEGLQSSELIFIRSLLVDSFDERNLKSALASKYRRDAKALKAHLIFMEKHGMEVSAEMEFAEKNTRYATMLFEKHKPLVSSEEPVIQNKEQAPRRIVLPLPK